MTAGPLIAIYLAAGESRRMGSNKLKLPLGSSTVGSSALLTAIQSRLDHTLVIAKEGDELDWISPALLAPSNRQRWDPVYCPESREGMSYSIRCGVQAAERSDAAAVMVLLADQPFITVAMINQLISLYRSHAAADPELQYFAFRFEELPRPPVIFTRSLFPALLQLTGDEGARSVIRKQAAQLGVVKESRDAELFADMDTMEQYLTYCSNEGRTPSD